MSRMSTNSRMAGSRLSDEDGKTSVRVGKWPVQVPSPHMFIRPRSLTILCSRQSAPASWTDRSGLRIDSSTIPTVYGPGDYSDQFGD